MGRMPLPTLAGLVIACGALVIAHPADAQSYGFDWVTIGDPGNRNTLPDEVPTWPDLAIGGVEYEYRLTRTEITVKEHFEFVQAAWPYYAGQRTSVEFTGRWITPTGDHDDPQYVMRPGAERRPTQMGWRVAAMYCNWLHNDKAGGAWAFADGAYDISTFGENPDGALTDQRTHHPGANFWIPTLDELTKGLFWDPMAAGGGGAYWRFPHSSDAAPISAAPWDGGETSAGVDYDVPYLDAGAYPWARSPWGLLDGSGGEVEWIEGITPDDRSRIERGTRQYMDFPEDFDRIEDLRAGFVWAPAGLRLASVVPGPSTTVLALVFLANVRRKRRI